MHWLNLVIETHTLLFSGNIGLVHDYSGGQANAFNSMFNDENDDDDGFDGSSRIVNNEKNLKNSTRPPKPR